MNKLMVSLAVTLALLLPMSVLALETDPDVPTCNQPPTQCWFDSACVIAGSPQCTCTWYVFSSNQCEPPQPQ